MTTPYDEDFTELADAEIDRVDLVDKAANGTPFLIMKRQGGGAGLLDADVVRGLVGKSRPQEQEGETVTMSGSPGAIARLIHEAAQRADLAKADYDTADRKHMASSGAAMQDGSYPIANRSDLENAIHAVGRGGADHDAIRRHIISRARSLGASSMIPDNWGSDGSLRKAEAMAKASKPGSSMELDDGVDGMDPTVALAAPDDDAPGDPMDPGSPAWEAIDAATARKWTSILSRAKGAVDLLAQRELMEAAGPDPEDAENAMDLSDACCAIDYIIGILAPFAVAEQAEADCGAEMMAVGKALASFDTGVLDTIEAYDQVRKAGRVLSTANEAAIRGAVEQLQKVLASLPQAPVTGDEVAKKESMTATTEKAAEVTKADKSAVAVYDKSGNLVGICNPADITPIADADSGNQDSEQADLEPAPPAEVGTPADAAASDDGVTKNASSTSDDVLKSITTLAEAFDRQSAAQNELVKTVEELAKRMSVVEEQPAAPRVFTNGAVPPQEMLRGHDAGAPAVPDNVADLRKSLYGAADVGEQHRATVAMQGLALGALTKFVRGETTPSNS